MPVYQCNRKCSRPEERYCWTYWTSRMILLHIVNVSFFCSVNANVLCISKFYEFGVCHFACLGSVFFSWLVFAWIGNEMSTKEGCVSMYIYSTLVWHLIQNYWRLLYFKEIMIFCVRTCVSSLVLSWTDCIIIIIIFMKYV